MSWPVVKVIWDAMPDCKDYEEPEMMEYTCWLIKWNKRCDNAWRLDVILAVIAVVTVNIVNEILWKVNQKELVSK